MKRILINADGPNPQAARIAYAAAIVEAAKLETRLVTLLVPVLKSWESSVSAQVLGKAAAKELVKNGSIMVQNVRLEIHSLNTLQKGSQAEVLFAAYVRPEVIDEAVRIHPSYKSCVYLPWMPEEVASWKALPPDEIKEVPIEPASE